MTCIAFVLSLAFSTDTPTAPAPPGLFARDNLVAWCIVPFDAKRRTPEERVAMLKRLGFKKYAYDWRDEHLPTIEREIEALQKNGIELSAVWFPAALNGDAKTILAALKKHRIKTQLWVTMSGGGAAKSPEEQRRKVAEHANAIRVIAAAAAEIGCSVGLYNHGSWFGEPENQLEILEALKLPSVGIVYNLHHGHDHLDRFPALLKKIEPHLFALNLNGMVKDGESTGRKILPLGQGDLDLGLLKTIAASGYRGPIGILGHTNDDAEERLKDNLDGLDWLLPQLEGKNAGPRPKPRTPTAAAPPATSNVGWIADGRPEYRAPPITVEVRARIRSKNGFNILIASDTKASRAHWELFTTPGDGHLTAYLPGRAPDHVRSSVSLADSAWHNAAMQLESDRVRLFVDGKLAADQTVQANNAIPTPGGFAFARLVEGGIGCDGELAWAKISRGVTTLTVSDQTPAVDQSTFGLWNFGKPDQPAADRSSFKNNAKPATAAVSQSDVVVPPPGPHLTPKIPGLRAVLIDRSQDDAYLAVKADGAGRLFVGGREAVFAFDPDGHGGFLSRRQVLRLPQDSIVIGLEYLGDDLYVQTVNALYLVPGGRVKRDGLVLKRLLWGLPQDFHISFHCLAWGPQGDLYLDHGDPLLNYGYWTRPDHWGHWTLFPRPEGSKVPYTGAGAVLRIHPDGGGLKVVATGLRGPVGLAFDRNWELFTNDNDHESRADLYAPARLLHVVPHADFAWPRGWMASKSPNRNELLEPVNSNMGRGVPCDQWIYDEPLIPELRGNLLLCRWDRMGVTRFPLESRGSTYRADELPFLSGDANARPTGIASDNRGRLFVTCHYLSGNVVTPHCVSDLVMITRDGIPSDPLGDETIAPTDKLLSSLSSPSGETRRRTHNELLRRGADQLRSAMGPPSSRIPDGPSDVHRPWLMAAAWGSEASAALATIGRNHPRWEVRLQAVRALAELEPSALARDAFQAALADNSPHVRLAALAGFVTAPFPPPIAEAVAAAQDSDSYMRQMGVTFLARRANIDDLKRLANDSIAANRLAGLTAAGFRLTVPPFNDVPPKNLALFYPKENPFFNRNLHFADGSRTVDLADLGRIGSYTVAERWKAIPHSPDESRLFDLLARGLNDSDDRVKSQCAFYLGLLRDPRLEPAVERANRELRSSGLATLTPTVIQSAWVVGPFTNSDSARPTSNGPVDLLKEYPVGQGKIGWQKASATDGSLSLSAPPQSVSFVYFRIQSRTRQTAMFSTTGSGAIQLWHNGRTIAVADGPPLLDLQPGGNELLLQVNGLESLSVGVRAKDRVTISLPEKSDASMLVDRLRTSGGYAKVGPEFLAIDWTTAARTGDVERGRRLFGSLGCVKCHAVTADQAGGGAPSLTDAGKRFTPTAIVESMLTPDRQVADDYRTTRVVLNDGQAIVGLVVKETPAEIELLLPDTTHRTVKTADVEQRKVVPGSPMPAGLVRTPAELRDLLAYLLSDHPQPP